MKIFLRRSLSFFLALLLASASIVAAASDSMGDDLLSQSTVIHKSTALSTNVFWSSAYTDLRTENLITYTPSTAVTPIVTYGDTLTAVNTISSAAQTLEAQGYRVVAGMNGDFYNLSTGLPIGLVVTGGELRSSDGGYYAVGFRADGTAVLGKPSITVAADLGYSITDADNYSTEVMRPIAGVNKARVSTGGIYLYTYDFNAKHTTGCTEPGVDVICTVADGKLSVGGTLTLTVDSVADAAAATAVPQGKVVLSCNSKSSSYYLSALRALTPGGTITVSAAAADAQWNDVQYAVGALYSLVENGSVVSGLPTGLNPRTAVGQKADGTLIFYTMDGRQSGYSIGCSLTQVAQRLIELGCVSALCLDGGGSTTLTVTNPDATAAQTINSPSGGAERAVSNQIFLVAGSSPSGIPDHLYVSADNSYVLAGSKVTLAASAVDTNYIPMSSINNAYSLTASSGSISGLVLTTPASGGDITVTASGYGKTGTTTVHTVRTPDSIVVKNASAPITGLTVVPGGAASLTAEAVYNHLPLAADAGTFTWTVSGNIGSVDATGRFTATTPGTGTLTVSAGGRSVTVAVTVSNIPLTTVQNFEQEDLYTIFTDTGSGAEMSQTTASEYVRFGRGAGSLAYHLGDDGTASLAVDLSFSSVYSRLNFWVYGDGSGNTLSLLTSDGSAVSETQAAVLDFTGWKQVSLTLPSGTTQITGLKITGATQVETDEEGNVTVTYPNPAGTIYLDQMVGSYGSIVDNEVPAVSAAIDGGTVTGSVSDKVDGILPKSSVSVTYDGKALAFTYDASSGAVTAALPDSCGTGHRITLSAQDASGNIGRASCDIAGANGLPVFSDTTNYWAQSYVDFLSTSGITKGYADGTFRPGKNITRQEFAVMLYRYLGLDGTQYESLTLPFADSSSIGDFAKTAVKALYSEGIINGSMKNGKLYFSPGSSLTRAQAAAMIGRTQKKGYSLSDLSFTDAASIPSYASFYIQTMAGQGVIGGFADGSFQPNANISRGQMAKILYNLL